MGQLCFQFFAIGTLSIIYGGILAPGPPESSSYDTTIELGPTVSGLVNLNSCSYGVKLSYPWSDHALLEGEYVHYVNPPGEHTHSLFLTGLRVGIRKRKFGAFFKLQPGMFRAAENPRSDPPAFSKFALSVGGVLEVHLDPRIYIRADNGYLIIWFGDARFFSVRRGTAKYFQTSFGIGVRF